MNAVPTAVLYRVLYSPTSFSYFTIIDGEAREYHSARYAIEQNPGIQLVMEIISTDEWDQLQADAGASDARVEQREACSSCGSTAEHHVQYVRRYGLCVV